MSDVTLKSYANRLGIHDSETINYHFAISLCRYILFFSNLFFYHIFFFIRKSVELLRLINLKASSTITNQTAKLILCIECASIVCGTDVDHQHAIKLSGLNKTEYNRQKDLIENLLNLSKKLTLDEICAQLEINERLKMDARQLFQEYMAKNTFYNDTNTVPILAMAIYQSLKLRKVKNSTAIKSKLMQIGKLKPKLWKQLEEEWDNWIEKCKPLTAAANDKQKMMQRDQSGSNGKKEEQKKIREKKN